MTLNGDDPRKAAALADTWLTVAEAAAKLRKEPKTIRKWLDVGYLTGIRLPSGRILIPASDVARLLLELPRRR